MSEEAAAKYNPDLKSHEEIQLHCDESLRLLSVNEARKILGISHITLKQLIEDGAIKSVRINTRYKISLSAIREFTDGIAQDSKLDNTIPPENAASAILDDLINDFQNKK